MNFKINYRASENCINRRTKMAITVSEGDAISPLYMKTVGLVTWITRNSVRNNRGMNVFMRL